MDVRRLTTHNFFSISRTQEYLIALSIYDNQNNKIINFFKQRINFDFSPSVDPDVLSQRTYRSSLSVNEAMNSGNRDFKILVESKSNVKHCIHLVAPTVQEKEAWISDISQCVDNIHMHTMLSPTTESIGLSP